MMSLFFLALSVTGVLDSEPLGAVGFRAVDARGQVHALLGGAEPAAAIVFLDPECPVARHYAAGIDELASRVGELGIPLFGLMSDPHLAPRDVAEWQARLEVEVPVLLDPAGGLHASLKPTHVPEIFLVDSADRLLYRGAIDDQFVAPTKRRSRVSETSFEDAVRAFAAGEEIAKSYVEPVGCVFEAWEDGLPETPDYARHVAPVLEANCVVCHRPGAVAPFAFDTPEGARRRAQMIADVTTDGLMPPWQADPAKTHFAGERWLGAHERELLARWAATGAELGEPERGLSIQRTESTSWPLGEPDHEFTMLEPFELPATGPDIYRYFVIPNAIAKDMTLRAMDFRPGAASVVHHCDFFVDYAGKARAKDAEDDEVGFSVFGTGGFIDYQSGQMIGGWAPGMDPFQLPDGLAMYLERGADLVLEIHYHLDGERRVDQSTLAFWDVERTPEAYIDGLFFGTQEVLIEPADEDYHRRFSMHVPVDMQLVNIGPHMHLLGKSATVTATLPDGSVTTLLDVPHWDFRWQSVYRYREPITLPAGTRIDADYRFDNGALNPAQAFDEPQRISWGWGSDQEMCEIYFTIVHTSEEDMRALSRASNVAWLRSADPKSKDLLERSDEPKANALRLTEFSPWDPEGVRIWAQWMEGARAEEAVDLLRERAQADGATSRDHGTLGIALNWLAMFERDERRLMRLATAASRSLQRAVELDPDNFDAQLMLAVSYAESGEPAYERLALGMLEDLVSRLRNKKAVRRHEYVYVQLGDLLEKTKPDRAAFIWRRGLARIPTASVLAQRVAQLERAEVRAR